MPFHPPFGVPPYINGESFPQDMQAPPRVRKVLRLSGEYIQNVNLISQALASQTDPDNLAQIAAVLLGPAATAAAELLVDQSAGVISQFWQTQHHQSSLGVARNRNIRQRIPGLDMTYQNIQGSELLTLEVYPSAPPASFVASILPNGNSFIVSAEFAGWPLPGYQYSAGGGQGWWTVELEIGSPWGSYYYDPLFIPGALVDPNEGDLASSVTSTQSPLLAWDVGSSGASKLGGFGDSSWWNKKIGGSGICTGALSGQQYWEVKIVSLPPAGHVPPSITSPESGPFLGFYNDPTFFQDNTRETWSWPAVLDTWLSPIIGLVPQSYVDPSWKGNHLDFGAVIGLDYDPSMPRSIGAVRSSLTTLPWNSQTNIPSAGLLTVTASVTLFYTNSDGGADFVTVGATSYQCISTTSPPPGNKIWNVGDVVGVGSQYLVMCVGSSPVVSDTGAVGGASGPQAGPSPAQCAAYVGSMASSLLTSHPVAPMAVGGAYFAVVGFVGYGLFGDAFYAYLPGDSLADDFFLPPGGGLGTITFTPAGDPIVSTDSGTKTFGDVFMAFDTFDPLGNIVLSGVNQLGRHCPIFKGRGDDLVSALTPSQDTSLGSPAGVWLGIDLGDLVAGDVIRIATDTVSRKVWFGKNKQWYDSDGASDFSPGDPELAHATVMDGDDKTLYYPACSWRFGPVEMQMNLSSSTQAFGLPGGFKSYSPSTTG